MLAATAKRTWLVALDPGVSPDTGESAAMRIHSLDHITLSTTTSSGSSADVVRILGDVSFRADLPDHWPDDGGPDRAHDQPAAGLCTS
jgi:hypothetical protein